MLSREYLKGKHPKNVFIHTMYKSHISSVEGGPESSYNSWSSLPPRVIHLSFDPYRAHRAIFNDFTVIVKNCKRTGA